MSHSPTLGVIVGRFQVARLHRGHRHLIDSVGATCDQVLIVLGSSRGLPSARNPLSFLARAKMIAYAYPKAILVEHFDEPTNEGWSATLDSLIADKANNQHVVLFGSRDSFLPHYKGRYETIELPEVPLLSGTQLRTTVREKIENSAAWRKGVIHANANKLPHLYSTVDVAVLKPGYVLLGEKKQDRGKLRFIGGFVDPTDASDEAAAKRELREEAGFIEVADWKYIGSHKVDDWRYRGGPDGIMTRFFATTYVFGKPTPHDDIDALHFIEWESTLSHLIDSHQPLGRMLQAFLNDHPNL